MNKLQGRVSRQHFIAGMAVMILFTGMALGSGGPFRLDMYVRDQIPGTKTFPVDLEITKRMDEAAKVSLKIRKYANPSIVDCQDADMEISGFDITEIEFKPLDTEKIVRFYVSFNQPYGEYGFEVEIFYGDERVGNQGHYFILEGNVIYHGPSGRACLIQKCVRFLGWPEKRILNNNEWEIVKRELELIEKERDETAKSRKEKQKSNILPNRNRQKLFSIKSGDEIVFTGKWTGFQKTSVFPTFPIKGAHIQVINQSSLVQMEGYLDDQGIYKFNAWQDNPQFTIKLMTEFQGFPDSSNPNTKRSSFEIRTNWNPTIETAEVISTQVGDQTKLDSNNRIEYISQYPYFLTVREDQVRAAAWSVYHAYHELFRLAGSELGIARDSPLHVYFQSFNAGGTEMGPWYYTSIDPVYGRFGPGIYSQYSYFENWDALGHELAHVLTDEFKVMPSMPGGGHVGNMYISTKNTDAGHNKEIALAVAFSEGFANYFPVSLFQRSPYVGKLDGIGDTKCGPSNSMSEELEKRPKYRGEDSEDAVAAILWDLYDSGAERYAVAGLGLGDQSNYGLGRKNVGSPKGMWDMLKGGNYKNISDFYLKNFPANDPANRDFLTAAPTFCEMGVAPLLLVPAGGQKWDLSDPKQEVRFTWKPNDNTGHPGADLPNYTGTAPLVLDDFKIMVCDKDLNVLWQKPMDKSKLVDSLQQRSIRTPIFFSGRNVKNMDAPVFPFKKNLTMEGHCDEKKEAFFD